MVNRFGEDSFVESFDDIRPYRDSEIPGAMHRIAESSWLPAMAEYVFPDSSLEEVRSLLHSLTTIDAFQRQVMYHFNRQVIKGLSVVSLVMVCSGCLPTKAICM